MNTKTTLTSGYTTLLRPKSIQCLVVVYTLYGKKRKRKCEITHSFRKTFGNTYVGVQFSEVVVL